MNRRTRAGTGPEFFTHDCKLMACWSCLCSRKSGPISGAAAVLPPKAVKEQIDFAGKYSKLSIRINSPGGDAFEGQAIFSLLRSLKKPIDVCVDGVAANAASIICMAGDTITMAPGGLLMIHEAQGGCVGTAADMRQMAEALGTVTGAIAETYAARTGIAKTEVLRMMAVETWLTAAEALELGFATSVADYGKIRRSSEPCAGVGEEVPASEKVSCARCAGGAKWRRWVRV